MAKADPQATGLSIGATRFAGVQLARTPVARRAVLTLFQHRAPELGVPGENPRLTEAGLVMTGFVDRVGDPVGIVAADGTVYRGELLVADALRELLHTATGDQPPAKPAVVTYPAHWRESAVDALRAALRQLPEWSRTGEPVTLISDAAATITALQSEAGVPAQGVIALCDFGGSGTSLTLLDASRGYAPLAPTVRHVDFSGDLIDQALLSRVVADLPGFAPAEATGTSALGSLHRMRAQCRVAKERLSGATVTSLTADLPGFRGDVRLTRADLDDVISQPLADFVAVVQETLDRNGIHSDELVAVASAGGGARIPLVTTTLSEHFRVPVITMPRPELAAATGAALRVARGPADNRATVAAPAIVAAPAFADADARSTSFKALAWSEAHDVPPLAPLVPEPEVAVAEDVPEQEPTGLSSARPKMEFAAGRSKRSVVERPWYRRGATLAGVGATALLLLAASAVVAFGKSEKTVMTTPLTPPASAPASGAEAPAAAAGPVQEAAPPADPPAAGFQAPVAQQQAPAPQAAPAAPPADAPAAEAPPPAAADPAPSSQAPPPPAETTTVTAAPVTETVTQPAQPPAFAGPPASQPPASQPPASQPAAPPSQSPVTVTIPRIPKIPGLSNPSRNH
ncbi:MAG: hypothetical protein QOH60_4487 [Mycobacterium sp.]|jgi:hypothetical protein|nr:hypothetical protein [Mycobacterium sp.]